MKLAFTTCALVLTATLLTLSSFYANADRVVYRWKDNAGNPVNSDRPPPQGVDYEVVSTSSSMVREVDAQEGAVPLEIKPTADNHPQAVNAKKPAVEKDPVICASARNNIEQIDSHARIRLSNDQGEVRYLTEEEKAAERQKALDAIKAYCD